MKVFTPSGSLGQRRGLGGKIYHQSPQKSDSDGGELIITHKVIWLKWRLIRLVILDQYTC